MIPRQFSRSKADRDLRAAEMAAADTDRGTSLLALALREFAGGNVDIANDLALMAGECLSQAEETKRRMMQGVRTIKRNAREEAAG